MRERRSSSWQRRKRRRNGLQGIEPLHHGARASGGDANELRVERALKLAIPITCIIIALFGAPLATSTQRGGAAYGIGISLATTVIF
jgi:lipopolysaccharide export LptBFGC system permease protein LptF